MKKRSLAIILALVLVMAFGTSAFAAQAISGAGFGGFNAYQATPTYTQVYGYTTDATGQKVYGAVYNTNTFNADGVSNYPYEIYLPNEENPAQYRIHTNYTKNTDACASCHATHTAVGASLLQWYSTFETCMACHDGTVTTTYNVEEGQIGTTGMSAFGGAFGNGSEAYASQHNVQGSVSISAAPGGSVVGKDVSAGSGKTISMWSSAFGCESCHTPHGQGGNARILNPDPNGYASLNNHTEYDVVNGVVYEKGSTTNHVTLIKGYPYVNLINNNTVESASYKIDNSAGFSVVKTLGGATPPAGIISVTGTASVKVTMNIKNYLGFDYTVPTAPVSVAEIVYHTSGINTFCGTCHTDYNTEKQAVVNKNTTGGTEVMGDPTNRPGFGALTGEYSKAHRHSVGLDFNYGGAADTSIIGSDKLLKTMGNNISCLTCHYAHGVNADFWASTLATYFTNGEQIAEIAGSSALKRIPNMGTCEACHQKADANQGYAANSTDNGVITAQQPAALNDYEANAAHASYFAGNTYQDATTCLICHTSAGDDFMKSAHWNIGSKSFVNKDFFGGLMQVNDKAALGQYAVFPNDMPYGMSDRFCGFPGGAAGVSFAYEMNIDLTATGATKDTASKQEGNSCGRCHASIGLNMPPLFLSFMGQNNTTMKKNIDCLACHIDREQYDVNVNKVVENGAFKYGNSKHGNTLPATSNAAFDVKEVGKTYKIEMPTNDNCMTCHEHAMAGPVYKRHALYSKGTDIHAAENMLCVDCHSTSKHLIAKGIQATDLVANDRPDVEVACVSSKCHGSRPHVITKHAASQNKVDELNDHATKLACISCHVKNETDAYANAAMAYVNNSQIERGYPTTFSNGQRELFKGGAIFNDFREFNDYAGANAIDGGKGFANTVGNMTYGFLGSIPESGFSEWMMVQPGNFAWRWFNGTGTGMANAVASFGFYDAYYYNDGFKGFRGTAQLPAPNGFGFGPTQYGNSNDNWYAQAMLGAINTYVPGYAASHGGANVSFSGAMGLPGLFSGYWGNYATGANDFSGYNSFDNELYAGAPKGVNGDKIYPFRKMQAWMPVPRTNFWFLTPHDMKTLKDPTTVNAERNYLALKNAIESPMMYMFFSGMFKPTMDLYAQEFGFVYQYDPCNITGTQATRHPAFNNTVAGLGGDMTKLMNDPAQGPAAGLGQLNGYIYNGNAYWLDDFAVSGDSSALNAHGDPFMMRSGGTVPPAQSLGASATQNYTAQGAVYGRPTTAAQGQNYLIAGQLDTYMYFPMPVDANIMEDHAIAAKDFMTSAPAATSSGFTAVKYEPRTCNECHTTASATTFDNKDWNPLGMAGTPENDAKEWGKNFPGTVNTAATTAGSVIDWRALGYSNAEIATWTSASPTATWNEDEYKN